MGEMRTLRVLRQLLKEWTLPDEMTVSWRVGNAAEVAVAEETFTRYLHDGWLAYSEDATGRRQIFEFNPHLETIVLLPPLGGGEPTLRQRRCRWECRAR
jgi:hypothetical protein